MKAIESKSTTLTRAPTPAGSQLLTPEEVNEVSGGLNDWTVGGMAVMALGIAGGVATGGLGLGIGLSMMYIGYAAGSGGGSGPHKSSSYSSH